MSKCPKGKILNPTTNRCITNKCTKECVPIKACGIGIKTKKKDLKKNKNTLKKNRNNIDTYLPPVICDKGLISNKKMNIKLFEITQKIGEINDIYCVSENKKNLAALDFSSRGIKNFKKLDTNLINNIIDHCNQKNVKYLHNTKNGGMYIKSVFFLQKNYNSALKLMLILWDTPKNINYFEYQIAIGLLLGYNTNNILFFLKKNYNLDLDKNHIKIVKEKIKKMNVSLEDLQQKNRIVLKDYIKNI